MTLFAPGAPAGAWVSMQWQDRAGGWHDVQGWKAEIDVAQAPGIPFKQWAVNPADYGRGPFRWVIYNSTGDRLWGVSPSFNLPDRAGVELSLAVSR